MKKIVWMTALILSVLQVAAFSGPYDSDLTAKQKNVNRQTPFNNLTDSLATVGKSKKDKAVIRRQRKEERRKNRLQKLTREGPKQVQDLQKERRQIHEKLEGRAPQK